MVMYIRKHQRWWYGLTKRRGIPMVGEKWICYADYGKTEAAANVANVIRVQGEEQVSLICLYKKKFV
jgi:hypothetical protein